MAVTIYDIAKASGTTHATVSRALRDDHAIAVATRKRIKALAREMGYVPNLLARGLSNGRTHTISLITEFFDLSLRSFVGSVGGPMVQIMTMTHSFVGWVGFIQKRKQLPILLPSEIPCALAGDSVPAF